MAPPAKREDGGASPPTSSIYILGLERKIRLLKAQIHYQQRALHDRNVALDAMGKDSKIE